MRDHMVGHGEDVVEDEARRRRRMHRYRRQKPRPGDFVRAWANAPKCCAPPPLRSSSQASAGA